MLRSLVGSEMCIRDSCLIYAPLNKPENESSPLPSLSCLWELAGPSYDEFDEPIRKQINASLAIGANVIAYATRFDNANLTNVNLTGAELLKSVFDGVTIDGADFTDAVLDRSQQKNLCKVATGSTAESLGCSTTAAGYVPATKGQGFNPGT